MAETVKATRTRTAKKASTKKKTVRRKTAKTPSKATSVGAGAAAGQSAVSDTERRRMIAEAAYYRAEHRDFVGGDPHQDWMDAEADIDARLAKAKSRRS